MQGGFMEMLFLLVRFVLGGFFAYEGAKYLTPYGRPLVMASGRFNARKDSAFLAVVGGLMMLVGGISVLMGIAPGFGVAMLVAFLALSSFVPMEPFRFRRNMALAAVLLLLLLVPRPWPLSFVS
jgi:uncharacterized membrane protein YphA (DoxX/SURF4 family)